MQGYAAIAFRSQSIQIPEAVCGGLKGPRVVGLPYSPLLLLLTNSSNVIVALERPLLEHRLAVLSNN